MLSRCLTMELTNGVPTFPFLPLRTLLTARPHFTNQTNAGVSPYIHKSNVHTCHPDSEWMSQLYSHCRKVYTSTITLEVQEISEVRSHTTRGAAATPKIVSLSGLSLPEALASRSSLTMLISAPAILSGVAGELVLVHTCDPCPPCSGLATPILDEFTFSVAISNQNAEIYRGTSAV